MFLFNEFCVSTNIGLGSYLKNNKVLPTPKYVLSPIKVPLLLISASLKKALFPGWFVIIVFEKSTFLYASIY